VDTADLGVITWWTVVQPLC